MQGAGRGHAPPQQDAGGGGQEAAGYIAVISGSGLFLDRAEGELPQYDGYWYSGGETTITDCSVRHILAPAALTKQVSDPLAAAVIGEESKLDTFGSLCKAHSYSFLPTIFQSTGGIGPQLDADIQKCAKRYATADEGDPDARRLTFVRYWRAYFGITLAKGYADKIASAPCTDLQKCQT